MKAAFVTAIVVLGCVAHTQDKADFSKLMAAPAEVKQLDFLVGSWSGDLKMWEGSTSAPAPTTTKTKFTLGDRWLHQNFTSEFGPGMTVEGTLMVSYDPAKKLFVGSWFDSTSPVSLTMSGTLADGKLTLQSEPAEIPMMPGKTVVRVAYTKKSADMIDFLFEEKSGDAKEWRKVMDGSLKRKEKSK